LKAPRQRDDPGKAGVPVEPVAAKEI